MNDHKDCSIYGIHTCEEVTPVQVRDAIIKCFAEAHSKELKDLKPEDGDEEGIDIAELNVKMMVRNIFSETGGDFENPTKESIIKVVEKLAEFAGNFRNQKVIKEHKENIMKLINCL